MGRAQIKKFCALDTSGQEMLRHAMEDLQLSARAYDHILKVSRTIADLTGADSILPEHIGKESLLVIIEQQKRDLPHPGKKWPASFFGREMLPSRH